MLKNLKKWQNIFMDSMPQNYMKVQPDFNATSFATRYK